MEGWTLEWLHLGLRWAHIVVGAAWIGASFYFNWLNNHVRTPEDPSTDPRIKGELLAVHGGAFYKVQKYAGAPATLPKVLHWFKFEAYFTWITGVLLLMVVYWAQAKAFLIDPARADLAPGAAIGLSAAALVGGWVVYDLLCKSPLKRQPAVLSAVGFGLIAALAFGLNQVFSARAATMHVGAVLGTIMAANVFFVIIPGQRAMVDALLAGREPDIEKGAAGALRSLHNNYLTLPVLFVMVSNHFPVVWAGPWGWALLLGLMIGSFFVRHWMNENHHERATPGLIVAAVAVFLGVIAATFPARPAAGAAEGDRVRSSEALQIVVSRCTGCHASEPALMGLTEAPKGFKLESMADLVKHADAVRAQAVTAKTMPLGNLTQMTDEERALLGRWLDQPRSE